MLSLQEARFDFSFFNLIPPAIDGNFEAHIVMPMCQSKQAALFNPVVTLTLPRGRQATLVQHVAMGSKYLQQFGVTVSLVMLTNMRSVTVVDRHSAEVPSSAYNSKPTVFVLSAGCLASGELRKRRGCQLAPVDAVQPLHAPLQRAQTGRRQRGQLRKADPVGLYGAPDAPARDAG